MSTLEPKSALPRTPVLRMTPEEDRWRVAVHEAGHAVAAALAGVAINQLTIEPILLRPGFAGWIAFDQESAPPTITPTEVLTLTMGSIAAEIAVLGSAERCGITGDRKSIDRRSLAGTGGLRSVWRMTYRLIRRNRAAVVGIASALMKSDTLQPVELYEDILPRFFPEAVHPRIALFEPSFAEIAARWDQQDQEIYFYHHAVDPWDDDGPDQLGDLDPDSPY